MGLPSLLLGLGLNTGDLMKLVDVDNLKKTFSSLTKDGEKGRKALMR